MYVEGSEAPPATDMVTITSLIGGDVDGVSVSNPSLGIGGDGDVSILPFPISDDGMATILPYPMPGDGIITFLPVEFDFSRLGTDNLSDSGVMVLDWNGLLPEALTGQPGFSFQTFTIKDGKLILTMQDGATFEVSLAGQDLAFVDPFVQADGFVAGWTQLG